jgi:Domain of unknown function (DUF4249)
MKLFNRHHSSNTSNISAFTHFCLFALTLLSLTSCEDVITLDANKGESQLVVDGWITNQPVNQQIRLTESSSYFDNSPAKPVLNATVTIVDDRGKVFMFKDLKNNGYYTWKPATGTDTLGRVGGKYLLNIKTGTEEYRSLSQINRVPKIDSISYYFDKSSPRNGPDSPKEGYLVEFFARDIKGEGDCYWVKSFKGQKEFNKPNEIIPVYDGAFSPGAATDGLQFIRPIRQSILGRNLALAGDTVRVDLLSISLEGFFFLQQVQQASQNGGLFAVPQSNIISNLQNVNPNGRKPLGFFGTSAVSTLQTIVEAKKARAKDS